MYTGRTNRPSAISEEGCFRLVLAFIQQAFEDASISDEDIKNSKTYKIRLRKAKHKSSAIKFFNSNIFVDYCDLVDLNPAYIRKLLKEKFKKRNIDNDGSFIQ